MLLGQDSHKGSANLAATFFALLLLGLAADTDDEAASAFSGVERKKLLRWMKKLQRPDGSFGQVLWEGEPVGGRDMRHSYLASCIRWILGGGAQEEGDGAEREEDVDVEGMIDHVRHTQVPNHEWNLSHVDAQHLLCDGIDVRWWRGRGIGS